MKLLISLFIIVFGSFSLMGQSASTLEAKLRKAKSNADIMELKYELARIYNRNDSSRGKAAKYAKEAYLAAKEEGDNFMLAKIGYLDGIIHERNSCLLYTSPSPRDATLSRMPSSA